MPCGEITGAVVAFEYDDPKYGLIYCVSLLDWPGQWESDEKNLRPRRDDYQQYEGLGSRDKLTEPLGDDPLPKVPVYTRIIR
jgi:hypothetical protein